MGYLITSIKYQLLYASSLDIFAFDLGNISQTVTGGEKRSRCNKIGTSAGEHFKVYMYLLNISSSESKLKKPWYRANDTEERNRIALKAYESLMTVTLRKPDSDRYRNFSNEVKQRARQRNGHSMYGEEEEASNLPDHHYSR